jgi:hypothetical protein
MPDMSITDNPLSAVAIRFGFCQDQLGNYFRFVPHRAPDVWREGQKDPPLWIQFYQEYLVILSKEG